MALRIYDRDEADTPGLVHRWSRLDLHFRQAPIVRVGVVDPDSGPADAGRVVVGTDVAVLEHEIRRTRA
jgi:hypothetical protein